MVEILKSGVFDTIQDLGRIGVQDYGVPYSGAMDMYSAKIANVLLGNLSSNAVLEMTYVGSKLKFHCDTEIALTGADLNPKLNSKSIEMHTRLKIIEGDVLSFGQRLYGCRCYLAVKGGFQSEFVMNSRSMYQSITKISKLKKGDTLSIAETKTNGVSEKSNTAIKVNFNHFNINEIEVFKGLEFNLLSEKDKEMLLSTEFTISNDSNRMAYQVNEKLENNLKPIITSFVLPGTIQLTPSGKLLILMRDCQITGGYPRVLQVTEQSINQLSQKISGEKFRFKCID